VEIRENVVFKRGFSRWYNRRNERFGTLWAERFKIVQVEDKSGSVEAVAAYIDQKWFAGKWPGAAVFEFRAPYFAVYFFPRPF